jgi:hypothetical protein
LKNEVLFFLNVFCELKCVADYGIPGEPLEEGMCSFLYDSQHIKSGTFNSPRYPGSYPYNTECTYILKTGVGEVLVFNFDVLLFPSSQVMDEE